MGFNGTTIINQLGFHEKINIIDDAKGPIYLDLTYSTIHLIKPIDDIIVYIDALNNEVPIPNDRYIDLFLMVQPKVDNINLVFDNTFIYDSNTLLKDYRCLLLKDILLSFSLYSIDSGAFWRISSPTTYGPDNGYSLVDKSTSHTSFNGMVSNNLNNSSLTDTKITIDTLHNIEPGNGKITLTPIKG